MRLFWGLTICTLAACGTNTRAPVEDRVLPPPAAGPTKAEHTVARGDTLYSIAFRYGLDYRRVAAANNIAAPYTIYPGQRIRLEGAEEEAAPIPATVPPPEASADTTASIKPLQPIYSSDTAVGQDESEDATSESPPAPPPAPVPPPKAAAKPAPAKPSPGAGGKVTAWLWPTAGPVTRGFTESLHKGIAIGGSRGDPVVAVAPGKVVYAGTGISGYGELLIVKHNEKYLTAYGHNDELLVSEGDGVAAGQTIARKGSSGTDTVKLHFEIREEGKPIDPQRLLPRR